MKKIIPIISLILLFAISNVFAAEACGGAGTADDQLIASKAKELVKDKTTRIEKISALHSFVRDEINQIEAKYAG
ncbi:MAG: hypothetical protein PHR77_00090 [Kiritimatiellae bacterium]|nr:hypothetical protein [Kiritimatiellia bacterium]MDD5519229.1 hypothetical protein [Kiritimatiellia bacterium]